LIQAGVALYKVQQFLGHKSPMMTQRYAHHYLESLRDRAELLSFNPKAAAVGIRGTAGAVGIPEGRDELVYLVCLVY
jgi:hypothetical protein